MTSWTPTLTDRSRRVETGDEVPTRPLSAVACKVAGQVGKSIVARGGSFISNSDMNGQRRCRSRMNDHGG